MTVRQCVTIFWISNSKAGGNECTHHHAIPHEHSPTSTDKGAEGAEKQREVTWLQSSFVYVVLAKPLNLD